MISIQWRLTVMISAVIFVIVGGLGLFLARSSVETQQVGLELKGRSLTELMASSGVDAMERGDVARLNEMFTGLSRDPDFEYAALYLEDGTLLAARGDNLPLLDDDYTPMDTVARRDQGMVHVETPVDGLERRGRLMVGFNQDRISEQQSQTVTQTVIAAIIALLAGGFIASLVAYFLGGPIREIALVSERIADGKLDAPNLDVDRNDEVGQMARNFEKMLDSLREIERHVGVVAAGDLTRDSEAGGDLGDALNKMVAAQRQLVTQISDTATDIRTVSAEILATSRQLEQTAHEQASVVEETLRTMESLLQSSQQISGVSGNVLDNAESTHANSQMIAERINALSEHTTRIANFLNAIKEIANKTDLLALNAALEGTRAGEAGRGFSLVAGQMQRLTVNVMDAVEDIKSLTTDVREATGSTVLATEDAIKRALSTEHSARQINLIIQQQRTGTQQVSQSMTEISEAIRQSVAASAQSAEAAAQLFELSEKLQTRVAAFRLNG